MYYFSMTATATHHLIFATASYRALDIDVDTHSKHEINTLRTGDADLRF